MDWYQLFEIVSLPDNIPIVLLAIMVPVYAWMGYGQALQTDRLIDRAEKDPEFAQTHHRKIHPWNKKWSPVVDVWPYLLRIEFLAAIIVTAILIVWSIVLDAPLEEPANPNLTMNPSKAPWYFLGLQEMLVYFDPWIAGVLLPGLIIVGLMAIPYCDVSPLGNGYYTFKQRKYAHYVFNFGWGMWLVLIFIGTFIRGPGWMWFWPGETWDHHRVVNETYSHLHEIVGLADAGPFAIGLFGGIAVTAYFAVTGWVIHKLYIKYKPEAYAKMNIFQYGTMQCFLTIMLALPAKMILWNVFLIKYVMVTPWFNI